MVFTITLRSVERGMATAKKSAVAGSKIERWDLIEV